jgi:CBS domain-containing protein
MTDASEQHPAPLPATVADVMHPPVTAVNQNDHVAAAAYLVTSGRFRHLPVMGDAGLVGIVDITDVCSALLDLSAAAEEPPSDP